MKVQIHHYMITELEVNDKFKELDVNIPFNKWYERYEANKDRFDKLEDELAEICLKAIKEKYPQINIEDFEKPENYIIAIEGENDTIVEF